tara:strand:- start:1863 stop:2312 length:450 start_codon:yes stop_codon:yes gene_type:complete
MNLENVNIAIAVMERVKERGDKVDMSRWQKGHYLEGHYTIKQAEEALHTCGTAACLAGWIAVSPEWKAQGHGITSYGAPYLVLPNGEEALEAYAIAVWLDIPPSEATRLTAVIDASSLYGKDTGIEAEDVLKVLYRLRDTGSIWGTSDD